MARNRCEFCGYELDRRARDTERFQIQSRLAP